MDNVLTRQNHYKKALDKELGEIEARQRQSEVRRLKQIRDLGVDLNRIQKTTNDLDFIDDEEAPRRHDHRRGSLPAIDANELASLSVPSLELPRRGRRLSCFTTTPNKSPEIESYPEHPKLERVDAEEDLSVAGSSGKGLKRYDGYEDLVHNSIHRSISSASEERSSTSSFEDIVARPKERFGNLERSSNIFKKSSKKGHNVTTVIVHDEEQEDDQKAPHVPSQSMFEIANRRGRRASEPAVGGFLLSRLQASSGNDTVSYPQRNNFESVELRKSIQKNLPSNIVAEHEDEDRHAEETKKSTQHAKASKPVSIQTGKMSSISENAQAGCFKNIFSDIKGKGHFAKEGQNRKSKGNKAITGHVLAYRPRRRSDGDVVTYSNAGKLQIESAIKGLAISQNKFILDDHDRHKDDVWQSVKKCRYLRGYDPPEMKEPANTSEFVFGREKKESLPAKSKFK